ncbi:unnamed protein product [Symbiodinium natans]|uniref:Uncharacterized protein n=1 Tax=Symbiodinium natans TaxID=878477 RepID=A0A812SFI6_9DINO|nr:unnamed protein product [Symbiodinium natans]
MADGLQKWPGSEEADTSFIVLGLLGVVIVDTSVCTTGMRSLAVDFAEMTVLLRIFNCYRKQVNAMRNFTAELLEALAACRMEMERVRPVSD